MTDRRIIDLRSDTVTVPSDAMRRAMAEAPVGDDVYGEDPSVNRLEAMAAEITGKEAAVYVASGTMSNLVAIMTHCGRGDEAIAGSESHVIHYEVAGAAAVAGVQLRPAHNDVRGRIDPGEVDALIRWNNPNFPRTALLCIENTHNRCGGAAIALADIEALGAVARAKGVRVHMDGARIFNAATALGASVAALAAPVDTVGFCLSKGLAAPIGSVLCGTSDFVAGARRMRRQLGGGMRQAGIVAAAGIYALEHMVERLADDHANAKLLARGLAELPFVRIDPDSVETNIVILRIDDWQPFARALKDAGVLLSVYGPGMLRMVTHYGIERADIEDALERCRHAASALA